MSDTLEKENWVVGGSGTKEDPFIHEYDWFPPLSGIAYMYGYQEGLMYLQSSTTWSNSKPVYTYYRYKNWLRGNKRIDTFPNWSNLIYYLEDLKFLGYYYLGDGIREALLDLNEKELKDRIYKKFSELSEEIKKRESLAISAGDKVHFMDGKQGRLGTIVKKKNKKLYVVCDKDINHEPYRFINHTLEKNELPLYDMFPYSNQIFGAIKYAEFEVLKLKVGKRFRIESGHHGISNRQNYTVTEGVKELFDMNSYYFKVRFDDGFETSINIDSKEYAASEEIK